MHLRPWFLGTHLLLLSFAAFGLATSADLAPARAQDPDEEPVKDGKWLYTRNCSGCHNDNGDGRGATILALGLTARDFKQGGFAFGDSRESITRTINTGIPGRSPMPPFKGTLTDDEIALVVGHVFTLMPPRKDERPKNTIMVVKDRPVIARGKLPPLVDGGADIPRGLLIGTPEGMTFEYDISDVRLLGVRLGGFADRGDWSDRGGGYLKPLGQLIYTRENDAVEWAARGIDVGGDVRPFRHELRSAWVRGKNAGVTYDILDRYGETYCRIDESSRVELLSTGPAFTRTWRVTIGENAQSVSLAVADEHANPWQTMQRPKERSDFPRATAWWISDLGADGVECVLPRASKTLGSTPNAKALMLTLVGKPGETIGLEASIVRVPKWSPELGEKLAKELGQ